MNRIDESFPYKDKDGKPMYREHQRGAIDFIVNSIDNKKKYIAIDAPVGSGKSIINYTAVHSIKGRHVYLTPQKQLQDQIGDESWDGVTVLKGYTGYACTYCQPAKSIRYKTNYEGDEVDLCNNMPSKEYKGPKFDEYREYLKDTLSELSGDSKGFRKYKTAFRSIEHYDESIRELEEYNKVRLLDIINKDKDGTKKKPRRYDKLDMLTLSEFAINDTYRSISCPLSPIECPKKSAKALSYISKIRVLSPDIMHVTNEFLTDSPFDKIDIMVIDEAHGFEDVMQRIFSSEIPIDILNDVFGIDMKEMLITSNPGDAINLYNDKFREYMDKLDFTLSVLSSVRQVFKMKTVSNKMYLSKSKADYVTSYGRSFSGNNKGTIENIYSSLYVSGEMSNFELKLFMMTNNSDTVVLKIEEIRKITSSIKDYFGKVGFNSMKTTKKTNMRLPVDKGGSVVTIDDDMIFFDLLMSLKNIVNKFVTGLNAMYKLDSGTPFIFSVDNRTVKEMVPNSLYKYGTYDSGSTTNVLSTILIDPGAVSRYYFYSKAKHVVFSTGTWVYKESLMRALGIGASTVFHNVQTTFNPKRRPVYLISDSKLTNFSEKNDRGEYLYKSYQGRMNMANSLVKMATSINAGYKKTSGENVNIIIHTNSFLVLRYIAEFGVFDTSKYIFHFQDSVDYIDNITMGKKVFGYKKDDFLVQVKNSPDMGLVFLSPSVTEGVDFKHKVARAQIVLKHPMPYLGNKYLQVLMGMVHLEDFKIDPDIYNRKTFTTVVQQYGRVMRDTEDWGSTFFVDQKTVEVMGNIIGNIYEIDRASIKYLTEGIDCKHVRNGIQLGRPSFKLDY